MARTYHPRGVKVDGFSVQEHPSYVRAVAAYCRDELTIEGHHVSGMHGHH